MADAPTSYEKAYEELEAIMNDLQENRISVDDLTAKVRRAAELISFCTDMLRSTEEEVGRIVEKLGL
jgi:exodeoxyribonuclease VII small subunit